MTANTTKKKTLEGEEKLLNNNFDQIYKGWWTVQRALVKDYPTALNIFTWLIEIADKKNSIIVSYESIGKSLGLSRTTVYEAIKYLKENAFLTVLKTGNMNIYVLNDQIVWKDTADKKDKFSQFSAKVHIMASEQEEPYRSQLIGHALPKNKVKKVKLSHEEAIKGFEGAAPSKQAENASQGLKTALNHPLEVQDLIEKGYKFVEETENAYEMENSKGILTIFPKK